MPRLFVAIDFPSSVKERIADLCYGLAGVRWVPMDQMHLTLRFIGDVGEGMLDDIHAALEMIEAQPLSLTLKGAGHFPPRRNPKVLWVGIEPSPALLELAKQVDEAVLSAGAEPERRKFSPHVTIARIKEEIPVSRIIPFLQQNALFATEPVLVEEFVLYSSELARDGAIHAVERTYPLGDGLER
jgi:2'-5' RNA ligase